MDSFLPGAIAGAVVDLTLHPIDTVKTRCMAPGGFAANGGFRQLLRGVVPALCGSMPGGAAFFGGYNFASTRLETEQQSSTVQMVWRSIAASAAGEAAACVVRSPIEILKNRQQVIGGGGGGAGAGAASASAAAAAASGLTFATVARVYVTLLARDVPFAAVQLPMLEVLRSSYLKRVDVAAGEEDTAQHRVRATCVAGFFAGGFAGWITTPVDVCKTRFSTAAESDGTTSKRSLLNEMTNIVRADGVRGLFAGATPRVVMISIGGTLFFGSFEAAKAMLSSSS